MQIVRESGLSWPAVKDAIELYELGDEAKLMPEPRGRKQGTGRFLSEEQENQLRYIIYRKRPWQVRINPPGRTCKLTLWNRDAVKRLILKQCGIELSVRGVAKYLHRWGFPLMKQNQRPIKRCSKEIQGWLAEHYEELHQRAIVDNADIYWICKKSLKIENYVQPLQEKKPRRQWRGINKVVIKDHVQTPEVKSPPKKLSMISAIDNSGKEHWLVRNRFTQENQINFLGALINTSRKCSLLIRSDPETFTKRDVWNWILTNKEKIEIFPPLLQGELERKEKEALSKAKKLPKEPTEKELHDAWLQIDNLSEHDEY